MSGLSLMLESSHRTSIRESAEIVLTTRIAEANLRSQLNKEIVAEVRVKTWIRGTQIVGRIPQRIGYFQARARQLTS